MMKSKMRWAGHVARMEGADLHTGFWWENLRERCQLQDPSVDGSIILKWNYKSDGGMAWIDLAQDKGRCRALVNTLMNLQVP